jgi:hypothetical protein
MRKHDEEIEVTRRLLLALESADFELRPSDSPDVDATIGGRSIGVEVTVFHADEGLGRGGSVLRATEEKTARQSGGGPYLVWGIVDPVPGLITRIRDKVTVVTAYDRRRFTELRLLIVAQFPKPGAAASTFGLSAALNERSLSQHLHELLSGSAFDQAYLHLSLEQTIYAWTRSEGWRLVKGSPSVPAGSELSFKGVLRDPEWLPTRRVRHAPKQRGLWTSSPRREARQRSHRTVLVAKTVPNHWVENDAADRASHPKR